MNFFYQIAKRNKIWVVCMLILSSTHIWGNSTENVASSSFGKNSPLQIKLSMDKKSIQLMYEEQLVFQASFPEKVEIKDQIQDKYTLEQKIGLHFKKKICFKAKVQGSEQAIAAETRGKAQANFPLIRTSHGLSNNLRNNAVYDRFLDWMLETPEGTRIKATKCFDGSHQFELTFTGKDFLLIFRPLYYQRHKNLSYFKPWTYQVYQGPVTGWSSWWAYFRDFTEKDMEQLLNVWEQQHLADFGYKFIQIDDVFQGEYDKNLKHCAKFHGYRGGSPSTWLDWKKDLFPGGLTHYVQSVKKAGFNPAIWVASHFSDEEFVQQHPDWFLTDTLNRPSAAPWVSYVVDPTNPKAANELIRPTFRGLKNAGINYVKIDILRHYLYDGLNNHPEWAKKKGMTTSDILRTYLKIAREELGNDIFLLACWGVRPEAIGIADACRIGGDGYGPVTMQQYNSWNGIVWRNDPDHCDILPKKEGIGQGNISSIKEIQAVQAETVIRPALASIAGVSLLLSDKPEVYQNPNNLIGLKKVAPVVFSVPGQLYDFDPIKTDWLKTHNTSEITSGPVLLR